MNSIKNLESIQKRKGSIDVDLISKLTVLKFFFKHCTFSRLQPFILQMSVNKKRKVEHIDNEPEKEESEEIDLYDVIDPEEINEKTLQVFELWVYLQKIRRDIEKKKIPIQDWMTRFTQKRNELRFKARALNNEQSKEF